MTGSLLIQAAIPLLIIGFAALVHGAVGIGFPLIATPLLAMTTDVHTAVLLLVIPTITLNILNILQGGRWRRSIAKYWPLAVYGMAGSVLGTMILVRVSPETFRPLLAFVLIFYLNADRLGLRMAWITTKPGTAMAVFGIAAGLLGGTVNVMLPALVVFALETGMDKTAMIQVFNFCFLLGKLTQGAVLGLSGAMTLPILGQSLVLAAAAFAVALTGLKLRDRIRGRAYRAWLRWLLMIMAGVLMVQTAAAVI